MPQASAIAPVLIVFVASALVSAAATPVAAMLARRLSILDIPGRHKAHEAATPLLGGLAVAGGAGLALLLSAALGYGPDLASIAPLLSGCAVILVAGLIDDLRGLAPRHKLLWQVSATAVAGAVVAFSGVRLELFLHWGLIPIAALTVIWIVGVTNIVNFQDNMNGLCAGLGAVAACSLAVYSVRIGQETVALVSVALGGACLGFLPYNWPRAGIFLGDTGSMLVGFTFATLAVMGVYTPGVRVPALAVLVPLLLLAVPIADAAIVVALRLRAGHPPWLGDRRHLSHRLVRRGVSPPVAVLSIWLIAAVCGLAALLVPVVGIDEAPFLLALVVCAVGAIVIAAGTRGLE